MNATIVTTAILMMVQPPSPASKASAGFDPCALMTKQEAQTALGDAVGEPKKTDRRSAGPSASVAACEYTSAARHSVHITAWRFAGDSAGMGVQIYKAECMKKERLPGVGDLACWNDSKHTEVQVLKGATVLIIEINRDGNATEALTAAAKNAAARLVNP